MLLASNHPDSVGQVDVVADSKVSGPLPPSKAFKHLYCPMQDIKKLLKMPYWCVNMAVILYL